MRQSFCRMLVALVLTPWTQAQQVPFAQSDGDIGARSAQELAQRIFTSEQMTIAQVSKREPIVESYLQSLDPEAHPENVIDDAYFLGRVSLNGDSPRQPRLRNLMFGARPESRFIRVNTGDRWPLYPDGYVDMLFVDITDFDKDHYQLTYKQTDTLGDKQCLQVSVRPLDPKASGRFLGDIWVDSTSFRIVRIVGTFSPKPLGFLSKYLNASGISRLGLYFQFEGWRQEVSPGVWLPSYTYFDEQRAWNAGRLTTSFHLRGHVWVWSYQRTQSQADTNPSSEPLGKLDASGVLAVPGEIEHSLNGIVEEIRSANGIAGPAIKCRVLLTTPVEMFSIDNTVLISRGLLNLVPDKSSLAALIAGEIANITLEHSRRPATTESSAFDGRRTPSQQTAANARMRLLLKNTRYADSVPRAGLFFAGLALHSSQVPHLMASALGDGQPDTAEAQPRSSPSQSGPTGRSTSAPALELRGAYGINSWENQIVVMGGQSPVEETNAIAPGRSPSDLSPVPAEPR